MSGDGSFETTVDLNAPVQEVFRHLTEPAAMIRWMGQHATLEPAPGGAFEFTLSPTEGGTRLRLVHRNLPPDEMEMHSAGWEYFLGRLSQAAGPSWAS